jgi:hypothetical protein
MPFPGAVENYGGVRKCSRSRVNFQDSGEKDVIPVEKATSWEGTAVAGCGESSSAVRAAASL